MIMLTFPQPERWIIWTPAGPFMRIGADTLEWTRRTFAAELLDGTYTITEETDDNG